MYLKTYNYFTVASAMDFFEKNTILHKMPNGGNYHEYEKTFFFIKSSKSVTNGNIFFKL